MTKVFTAKTTGDEVATEFVAQCKGKTIIVTGANTGLGLETSRVLAAHGACVILAIRNVNNAKIAIDNIKHSNPAATVAFIQLDLASFASIRQFVKTFSNSYTKLHVLINNAAVMACPKSFTTDGFEMQFGVCHLGHFYLSKLLLPLLLETANLECPARIVNVSSDGQFLFGPPDGILFDDLNATKSYDPWVRYGNAKLANVLFSNEVTRRYNSQNLISVSLHPGIIQGTELSRHIGLSGGFNALRQIVRKSGGLSTALRQRSKTIPEGVATTVLAALDPEIVGGGFYLDCKKSAGESMHPMCDNVELARRLWDVSESLVVEWELKN
ncbi:hypothetical protein HK100_003058 [Physocladia obscura]|uniref:Uncharacterized protein n=1 Tax=Physocladia obscura TaxID=109957 RepID=A0AAD5T0G8_9FUNG|nr:hypothetical protein HK100_003058 [Physocladia obscura]